MKEIITGNWRRIDIYWEEITWRKYIWGGNVFETNISGEILGAGKYSELENTTRDGVISMEILYARKYLVSYCEYN